MDESDRTTLYKVIPSRQGGGSSFKDAYQYLNYLWWPITDESDIDHYLNDDENSNQGGFTRSHGEQESEIKLKSREYHGLIVNSQQR